jgi:hypothetical protein
MDKSGVKDESGEKEEGGEEGRELRRRRGQKTRKIN